MKPVIVLTYEYPPFQGGIATYAHDLAQAIARIGHPITVHAPDFGAPDRYAEQKGVSHQLFPGHVFRHKDFPKAIVIAFKAIRANPNAIFLAADWPFVAACSLLRRVMYFDYVAMLHGSEILFFRNSRIFNLAMFGNPFHGAKRLCANSRYTASLLKQAYPRSPNATITYLGVDPSWMEPIQRSNAILEELGITPDKTVILSVGRIHPRKGQETCIRALNALPSELKQQIVYVIAGPAIDSTYTEKLNNTAATASVPVSLIHGLDKAKLRALYARSDIFALPSEPHGTKVEGFGLVFLEAACFGLPSIALRAAAVPEVVEHGKTGLLTEPGDLTSLTQAFHTLLTDRTYRHRLGQAAQKRAREFTWDNTAKQTLHSLSEYQQPITITDL